MNQQDIFHGAHGGTYWNQFDVVDVGAFFYKLGQSGEVLLRTKLKQPVFCNGEYNLL